VPFSEGKNLGGLAEQERGETKYFGTFVPQKGREAGIAWSNLLAGKKKQYSISVSSEKGMVFSAGDVTLNKERLGDRAGRQKLLLGLGPPLKKEGDGGVFTDGSKENV